MADTTRAKAKLLENWQVLESSNLYHNQGGRDAVYALYLYREDQGAARTASAFRVRSDWGKRNAALQTTLKPAFPTTYERAFDIYQTLRKEKLREGYQVSSALTPRLMNDGRQDGSYAIMAESMRRKDIPTSAFICPQCKAPFNKEDEYLAHMEWHDRQNTAAFREAEKRQSSGLRSDGWSPAGMYMCSLCRQRYRTQSSLTVHMSMAHPQPADGWTPCPVCGKKFSNPSDLGAHIVSSHSGVGVPAPMPDEKPSLTRKATRKIVLDDD